MADEGKPTLLGGLWRFFSFWKLRKALGLVRMADRQFTGSVGGIRDAFDIHHDELVTEYKELEAAIAEVENVIEQDRITLEELNDREKQLIEQRDGALALFEKAQAEGNQAELATHQSAFERFDGEIQKIEDRQQNLQARITETEGTMSGYLQQLTKMQAEIRQMPKEKAQAMADFVSSQKIIELNDRLNGIRTSIERGPIEAVLEQNKKLTAQARVSQKLAGADVERQDEKYASAGRTSTSSDRMSQMLAARKAERSAKTGETPESKEERPEI